MQLISSLPILQKISSYLSVFIFFIACGCCAIVLGYKYKHIHFYLMQKFADWDVYNMYVGHALED